MCEWMSELSAKQTYNQLLRPQSIEDWLKEQPGNHSPFIPLNQLKEN